MAKTILSGTWTLGDCNSMPWDEAKECPTRALQEELDVFCSSDGSVSDEWRRIGKARRKLLLDEDRRNGGTHFDLNKNCNVDRYFEVAHRALEQFHRMYQEGGDLEETYIMGFRMVSFLTECLPKHPGYRRPAVTSLRKQCLWELDHLRVCLEDLALKIDEEQCNRFAEDFDPLIHVEDHDSDSEDDEVSATVDNGWVAFGETKSRIPHAESPTSTVATSGTASLEAADCYSSDDSMPERKIDFSDCEVSSPSTPSYRVELSTDFLEQIANEEVEYESDSDAADSWAQDEDAESFAPSYCSGQGIVCDPARIAVRNFIRRASQNHPLSPIKCEDSDGSLTSPEDGLSPPRRPDPPAEVSRVPSPPDERGHPESQVPFIDNHRNLIRQCPRESAVACEIQKFLDASFEYDPSRVFDSSMEQLNNGSPSQSLGSIDGNVSSRSSSSNLAVPPANHENDTFPVDNGWVSFVSARESQPRSYRVKAWSHK